MAFLKFKILCLAEVIIANMFTFLLDFVSFPYFPWLIGKLSSDCDIIYKWQFPA